MQLKSLSSKSMEDFRVLFPEDYASEDLKTVRWVAPLVLFVATFAVGIAPLLFRYQIKDRSKLRSYLRSLRNTTAVIPTYVTALSLSGGLLLAMVFVNLLPKARSFTESSEFYPGAAILMCMGFVLTYCFQESVKMTFDNTNSEFKQEWHLYIVQYIFNKLNLCFYDQPPKSPGIEELSKDTETTDTDGMVDVKDVENLRKALQLTPGEASTLQNAVLSEGSGTSLRRIQFLKEWVGYLRRSSPRLSFKHCLGVLMLCLHGIPDGLCIGLQSEEKLVWYVVACIAVHRFLIASSTGYEMLAANFTSKQIASVIFIYSAMAPIGGVLGATISDAAVSSDTLAVTTGLSAGSLMYMVFLEILRNDKSKHIYGFANGFAVFCGFSISVYSYLWLKGNFCPSQIFF